MRETEGKQEGGRRGKKIGDHTKKQKRNTILDWTGGSGNSGIAGQLCRGELLPRDKRAAFCFHISYYQPWQPQISFFISTDLNLGNY